MKHFWKVFAVAVGAWFVLSADSCDTQPTVADKEASQQIQQQGESNVAVPQPAIINWTEKRIYAEIYQKRDIPHLSTYTYLVGMHNEHTPLCRSEGFGIPESEQFTAPEAMQPTTRSNEAGIWWERLPLADPNGLYSSPSANGTWVLCLQKDGKVEPVRSEPNVITLTVPWDQLNQDGM
jgi:hypothetical protein